MLSRFLFFVVLKKGSFEVSFIIKNNSSQLLNSNSRKYFLKDQFTSSICLFVFSAIQRIFIVFSTSRKITLASSLFEVSWSHITRRHSGQDSSGRVINPSHKPLPNDTQQSQQTSIHAPLGFETTTSEVDRLNTYALLRTATGTDISLIKANQIYFKTEKLSTIFLIIFNF
jgi:hypothetical protein